MNKFEISSAFIIGHDIIDKEHAELVSILNDMVDCFLEKDVDYCKSKWIEFCDKLKLHFDHEMEIMAELGFKTEKHEDHHRDVLKHILKTGTDCNTLEDWQNCLFIMRNDLLSWVLKHDLGFAEHLVSTGYNEY